MADTKAKPAPLPVEDPATGLTLAIFRRTSAAHIRFEWSTGAPDVIRAALRAIATKDGPSYETLAKLDDELRDGPPPKPTKKRTTPAR